MDPVEIKRVRKLFIDSAAETAKAIMEMNETKFSESPVELNRSAVLQVLESILKETENVLTMCDIGGLNAYYAEIQINQFTNQVLLLTRHVQAAMPNAGETLHCVLCGAVKTIRDISMSVIRDIVAAAAQGCSRLYPDLLVNIALLQVEMESFKTSVQLSNHTLIEKRLSLIQSKLKKNADAFHTRCKNRILPLMAGRISYDAGSLIEMLHTCNFLSPDVCFVASMEELLRKSIYIEGKIQWIHKNLFSLEQFPMVVKILDDILGCKFVDSVDYRMYGSVPVSDIKLYGNELSDRQAILNSSILGFKSVLNYRSRYG